MAVPNAIPNRLRELRLKSKLTQEEVAKLLDIDHTTVSKHETLQRALGRREAIKYAQLYKVETHELFLELGDDDD